MNTLISNFIATHPRPLSLSAPLHKKLKEADRGKKRGEKNLEPTLPFSF